MAIKTKDELLESLRAILGESTDDVSLSLLEDVSDTIDDYVRRVESVTDWESKYNELDAEWRQKYRDRFYTTEPKEDIDTDIVDGGERYYDYGELFEEKKED